MKNITTIELHEDELDTIAAGSAKGFFKQAYEVIKFIVF